MKLNIEKTHKVVIENDEILELIKSSKDFTVDRLFNNVEIEQIVLGFDDKTIKVIVELKEGEED